MRAHYEELHDGTAGDRDPHAVVSEMVGPKKEGVVSRPAANGFSAEVRQVTRPGYLRCSGEERIKNVTAEFNRTGQPFMATRSKVTGRAADLHTARGWNSAEQAARGRKERTRPVFAW